MSNYLKEFDDLLAELKAPSSNYNELESKATLISTLPAEFDPLITSFGEVGKGFSTISLENLKGSLLIYDLKKCDSQPSTKRNEQITFVDENGGSSKYPRSQGQPKFLFKCNFCKQVGHTAKDCHKKQQSANDNQKKSNRKRSNGESSTSLV